MSGDNLVIGRNIFILLTFGFTKDRDGQMFSQSLSGLLTIIHSVKTPSLFTGIF